MPTESPKWHNNANAQEFLNPALRIWETLLMGANNHQVLQRSGRFDNFKCKKGLGFMNAFLQDPMFLELYEQVQFEAISTTKDDVEFQRHLRGAIFEKMAYAHLSSVENGQIPIWGEDVLKISRTLYPNALEIDDGLGQVGLKGIYIPDGFFLSTSAELGITGIVESKLGNWFKENKDKQISGMFSIMRDLQNFMKGTKLYVVSPLYVNTSELNSNGVQVNSMQVPILLGTFMKEFMPYVYYQHKGQAGKTISDVMQQRER